MKYDETERMLAVDTTEVHTQNGEDADSGHGQSTKNGADTGAGQRL